MRDRHAAFFAHQAAAHWDHWTGPRWREAVDWVEVELGNLRSAFRWSSGPQPRRGGDRHRRARRADGVLGPALRDRRVGRGQIDAAAAADVPRLPRLYTGAGYACFAGRPAAARQCSSRHELETTGGYDPCEPGYAIFIEALGQVYCGDLERYVELTGAVAGASARRADTAWRRTSTGCSRPVGSTRHSSSPSNRSPPPAISATPTGSPTPCGSPAWRSPGRRAAGAGGVGRGRGLVREHRVQFFDGFLARDAARLHTSDGEPDRARPLRHRDRCVPSSRATFRSSSSRWPACPRCSNDSIASTPPPRCSVRCHSEPSSFHHVPELTDTRARVSSRLGAKFVELEATGAAFDLNDAAV